MLDPESPEHYLDVVSVIEAVLEPPRQVLFAQQNAARAEAVAEMKAEGIEYDERVRLVEEITWPQPLAELLTATYEIYRETHPWLPEEALAPKSVVREMYEQGMTFTDFVSRYQLARSEGLVLRYLTDAYRFFRHSVPEAHRSPELDELVEWLGETVRQTDSSLLDEWEALTDPELVERVAAGEPAPPVRPITGNVRAFTVMVRNALFQRVQLAARDRFDELGALEAASAALTDPPGRATMTASDWEAALGAYWDEHETIGTGPAARSPELLIVDRSTRVWQVRQIIDDPEGDHDFAIVATVDLDASDAAGEPVVRVTAFEQSGLG